MTMIRRTLLMGLGGLLLPAAARAQDGPQPALRKERITIETMKGKHYDFMVEMAKTKTQRPGTTPIAEHPLVQRTVAEVGTAIRAARLLLHDAARIKMADDREATMLVVNQAKTYCSDVGLMATSSALRMAGGTGILKSLPLERWHRDALAGPVMPPANDRCLETVGKLLCGLRAATLEFQ